MEKIPFAQTIGLAYLNTRRKSKTTGKIGVVEKLENVNADFMNDVKAHLKFDDGTVETVPILDTESIESRDPKDSGGS